MQAWRAVHICLWRPSHCTNHSKCARNISLLPARDTCRAWACTEMCAPCPFARAIASRQVRDAGPVHPDSTHPKPSLPNQLYCLIHYYCFLPIGMAPSPRLNPASLPGISHCNDMALHNRTQCWPDDQKDKAIEDCRCSASDGWWMRSVAGPVIMFRFDPFLSIPTLIPALPETFHMCSNHFITRDLCLLIPTFCFREATLPKVAPCLLNWQPAGRLKIKYFNYNPWHYASITLLQPQPNFDICSREH